MLPWDKNNLLLNDVMLMNKLHNVEFCSSDYITKFHPVK